MDLIDQKALVLFSSRPGPEWMSPTVVRILHQPTSWPEIKITCCTREWYKVLYAIICVHKKNRNSAHAHELHISTYLYYHLGFTNCMGHTLWPHRCFVFCCLKDFSNKRISNTNQHHFRKCSKRMSSLVSQHFLYKFLYKFLMIKWRKIPTFLFARFLHVQTVSRSQWPRHVPPRNPPQLREWRPGGAVTGNIENWAHLQILSIRLLMYMFIYYIRHNSYEIFVYSTYFYSILCISALISFYMLIYFRYLYMSLYTNTHTHIQFAFPASWKCLVGPWPKKTAFQVLACSMASWNRGRVPGGICSPSMTRIIAASVALVGHGFTIMESNYYSNHTKIGYGLVNVRGWLSWSQTQRIFGPWMGYNLLLTMLHHHFWKPIHWSHPKHLLVFMYTIYHV